jgi:hypothetical protein
MSTSDDTSGDDQVQRVRARSRVRGDGESKREKRFLLELVGFCRAGRGTGAGRTLHGAHTKILGLGDALKTRQNIEESAHVRGLFLDPDNFTRIPMRINRGGDFILGERIELIQEEDRGGRVFAAAAFGAELVTDLAAGDEDTLGVSDLAVWNECKKARTFEVFDWGRGVGMAQHAFRRENDQRFAPKATCLPSKEMEVLSRSGGLADVHIAFRSELHEALNASAGVLGPLAFVAVREQQDQAGRQAPFVFTGTEELVDDDLRAVDEVAELRFPEDECFRIVAREAVLEAEAARFGE